MAAHPCAAGTSDLIRGSLGGLALLLALGQTPAPAATFTVADGDVAGLIASIDAANVNVDFDTIELAANGTFTLTAANSDFAGLPVINSPVSINGNGATIQRAGTAPDFRIFQVTGGFANLTLQQVTVNGGADGGSNSAFTGAGGVLVFEGSTLTVTNSTISGNSASQGGGIGNFGTTTIMDSTISGNSASSGGGVLGAGGFQGNGNLTIINSTISGNSASGNGGGGALSVGAFTMTNSTVSGNSVSGANGNGGGLNLQQGTGGSVTATVTNSTISGNSASGFGGGLYNVSESAEVINSTLSGNTADKGGGVFAFFGPKLTHSTLSGNSASSSGGGLYNLDGTATLTRTLVSGNTAPSGSEIKKNYGAVNANNYNLLGHSGLTNAQAFVGFTPGATDITATSDGSTPAALMTILDATLGNNGGPTLTHALLSGSPAINALTGAKCPPPPTDQRGVSRPQGCSNCAVAACDVGAFEFEFTSGPQVDLSVTKTGSPDPVTGGGELTYTMTVSNNGPREALNKSIQDFSQATQSKKCDFCFASFSTAYIRSKWRHIPVPQEPLT